RDFRTRLAEPWHGSYWGEHLPNAELHVWGKAWYVLKPTPCASSGARMTTGHGRQFEFRTKHNASATIRLEVGRTCIDLGLPTPCGKGDYGLGISKPPTLTNESFDASPFSWSTVTRKG